MSGYALPQNGHTKHSRYPSLNGMPFDQSSPVIPLENDHFDTDAFAPKDNAVKHSQRLPMKGRVRGESDLGRQANGHEHAHVHKHDSE